MATYLADEGAAAPGSWIGGAVMMGSLLALLAVTAWFAWYTWTDMGDVGLSWPGIAAALAGSAVGIGLGVGLMRLCYISSRCGYDDEAGTG